jgi:hypothetical protein
MNAFARMGVLSATLLLAGCLPHQRPISPAAFGDLTRGSVLLAGATVCLQTDEKQVCRKTDAHGIFNLPAVSETHWPYQDLFGPDRLYVYKLLVGNAPNQIQIWHGMSVIGEDEIQLTCDLNWTDQGEGNEAANGYCARMVPS